MTQRSNPGAGFVEALIAAAGGADPRRQVEAVLRLWRGEKVYIPRGQLQRFEPPAELARRLVFGGVGRRAAVELVRDKTGVTDRHARRLVRAAVDMRGQRMTALAGKMPTCNTTTPTFF